MPIAGPSSTTWSGGWGPKIPPGWPRTTPPWPLKLNLSEKDLADQPAIIAAVREWLRLHQNWLLIIDNAQKPDQIIEYLPGGHGHVLITSRHSGWDELAGDFPVPLFPREQSVQFLLNRTQQNDAAAANRLADALGDLPLALEQAGAYIRAVKGLDCMGYLQRFNQYRTALFQKGKKPTAYPDTVATTWEISFQAVAQESPAAADLLHLCAFLAPDTIPLDIVRRHRDQIPGVLQTALADDLNCDVMLALLQRYSLLEIAPDALSIHRLVQAVIRDRLDDAGRQQWAQAAVKLVNAAFPGDKILTDPKSWPLCARLLPHAKAAAGYAEAYQVGLEATGRLLNQAGLYLKDRADYAAAQAAYERALAIDEAIFGPEHPTVATRLNNLATLLLDTSRLADAEALMRRALAIDEHSLGTNHPNVARDLNNLAALLQATNRLTEAEHLIRRALAIDEAIFGPEHPTVAIRLNNLARLLQATNRHTEAEPLYLKAIDIFEKSRGPHHPKVASALNNLATLLQATNRLAEAEPLVRRAVTTLVHFTRTTGREHPHRETFITNYMGVLRAMGTDEAEILTRLRQLAPDFFAKPQK